MMKMMMIQFGSYVEAQRAHTCIHIKIYNAQHSQACSSNQRHGDELSPRSMAG